MVSLSAPARTLNTPVPLPLRAAEIPSFTNYSVVVRLPDIARRTLAENQFPPEVVDAIQALIAEIPHGKIRPVLIPLAPDAADWDAYIRGCAGQNWLDVPWFFAEEYFYLRILEATGYYMEGLGERRDPYAAQKMLGLNSSRAAIRNLTAQVTKAEFDDDARDTLRRLLLVDLWGNQNDLSMWPVSRGSNGTGLSGGSSTEVTKTAEEQNQHILSNDLEKALDTFVSLPSGARFDLLLDNAGYELVTDLALADFLLTSGRAGEVVLHVKNHPVFVSDALDRDVHLTLDSMLFDEHSHTQLMARRLRSALVAGGLRIQRHPFWTSPLAAWEMPAELAADLSQSGLLISKGDANYRRLLGDRHWPFDLPFAKVVDYFPCPVLALRTLKSEITTGVDPDLAQAAAARDKDWLIDGRWGLIQFAPRAQ